MFQYIVLQNLAMRHIISNIYQLTERSPCESLDLFGGLGPLSSILESESLVSVSDFSSLEPAGMLSS